MKNLFYSTGIYIILLTNVIGCEKISESSGKRTETVITEKQYENHPEKKEEFSFKKISPQQLAGLTAMGANTFGYQEFLHKETGVTFILLPGAKFIMGSNSGDSNEKPAHTIILDDFLISKYEITQTIWEKIMGSNPSQFQKGGDYPVEKVRWRDAQDFCAKTNFRLPTEAEWEYACRSLTTTKFYWGDSWSNDCVWHEGLSEKTSHPVGKKKPNNFGLYDMSGNVWEWCSDFYSSEYYKTSLQYNPKGPETGQYRVLRGGAWSSFISGCRSSYRNWHMPDYPSNDVGLRCVFNTQPR